MEQNCTMWFLSLQGLPSDQFSTENGVIVTRGNRYGPLKYITSTWVEVREQKYRMTKCFLYNERLPKSFAHTIKEQYEHISSCCTDRYYFLQMATHGRSTRTSNKVDKKHGK